MKYRGRVNGRFLSSDSPDLEIIPKVAKIMNLNAKSIIDKGRTDEVAMARFMVIWFLMKKGYSTVSVARVFNKYHASIIYGNKTAAKILKNPKHRYFLQMFKVMELLKENKKSVIDLKISLLKKEISRLQKLKAKL